VAEVSARRPGVRVKTSPPPRTARHGPAGHRPPARRPPSADSAGDRCDGRPRRGGHRNALAHCVGQANSERVEVGPITGGPQPTLGSAVMIGRDFHHAADFGVLADHRSFLRLSRHRRRGSSSATLLSSWWPGTWTSRESPRSRNIHGLPPAAFGIW